MAVRKKKTRGRGRPAVDPADRLDQMVIVRFNAGEFEALGERADREGRSLANAIRVYLIDRGFFRRPRK